MNKEIIICIIVIVFVITIDIISQNFTKDSIKKITDNLDALRNVVKEEVVEESNNITENILDMWDEKYEVLSFYIEHTELEKVKTELVELKANVEEEQYGEAVGNIDRSTYLLEHIKQKMSFQIKNIF